jgi:arylsulfatase/arylsulfatase A
LTGRYNYRTGVTEVARGRHLMHADEVTIAEILHQAGYRTGIFGKWHLGDNYPMRPTDQGFEEALVHKGGGIGQAAGPPGNTYFDPILEHNNVSKKFRGYCDDIFTDAAIKFIETNRDRPFFAYLATNLPHLPLEVPDVRADPYRKMGLHEHNARVYGMITNIDANVGRVLAKLKQLGLEKKTIVIFLSDNGPRTRRTKNDVYPDRYVAGLRGTKTSVYENGIRVPFFIRWPGKLPAGKKVGIMAGHIDILPTVLEVCQIAKPEGVKLDGHSLIPVIHGESVYWSQRNLYFQWHSGPVPFQFVHFTARSQRYKLVQPQDNPHAIITHPSREDLEQMLATLELYDIQNDPSELNNIARNIRRSSSGY